MYDGDSILAPLLAKLSGSKSAGTFSSDDGIYGLNGNGNVISSSNDIFVSFVADESENKPGFKIQFESGKYQLIYFHDYY